VTAEQAPYDVDAIVRATELAARQARPEFGEFFLARFLGLEIRYDDELRRSEVLLPYAPHLLNPQGSMHGGILVTAMDIAMGHLCRRHVAVGVTVETQCRFIRRVDTDAVAVGSFLHIGRKLVHMRCELRDASGRLAAHATSTWLPRSPDRAADSE
jgi:acyl-CoA thioesterase